MKHSENFSKLALALVAAQAELRAVGKDSVNPHYRNSYASLDNIIESIRPTLARHKLAVIQGAITPESDANAKLTGFAVETMLVHESGEWLSNSVVMPIGKVDPQGAGAALTYGRRYSLSAMLCLATDDDDDGNAASKQGNGRAANRSAATESTSLAHSPVATAQSQPLDQTKVMPFGKSKGTPLDKMDPRGLGDALDWAKANSPERYAKFIDAAEFILSTVGV